MLSRTLLLVAVAVPLCLSGCAIYTPFEVKRFWADYNTERECNAQYEVYDHLPPKTARVKMYEWGYNVGPPPTSYRSTFSFISDYCASCCSWGKKRRTTDESLAWIETAPGSQIPGALPLETMPAVPPPAPPMEDRGAKSTEDASPPPSASARSSVTISPASYQQPAEGAPARKSASPAWMFAPAQRGRP